MSVAQLFLRAICFLWRCRRTTWSGQRGTATRPPADLSGFRLCLRALRWRAWSRWRCGPGCPIFLRLHCGTLLVPNKPGSLLHDVFKGLMSSHVRGCCPLSLQRGFLTVCAGYGSLASTCSAQWWSYKWWSSGLLRATAPGAEPALPLRVSRTRTTRSRGISVEQQRHLVGSTAGCARRGCRAPSSRFGSQRHPPPPPPAAPHTLGLAAK